MRSQSMELSLPRAAQQSAHDGCNPLPVLRFHGELLSSLTGEAVELRFAIVVGNSPTCGDPFSLLKPQQGRVERPLIELKKVFGDLLDAAGDSIAVERPKALKSFQNHQIERSLQNVGFGFAHGALSC